MRHPHHAMLHAHVMYISLLVQCIGANNQEHLSLLQSRARAIGPQDTTDPADLHLEPLEVSPPKFDGKDNGEVLCMLKDAVAKAHDFKAVRKDQDMDLPDGYRTCAVVSNSGVMNK